MSHYKPYPAYRESGVEWIGQVPEHWETLRIKRAAALRNERRNDLPNGWPYVGLEDVEPESGRYAPTKGESRQSDDSMVGVSRAGDVLYGKLRPYLRKAIVAERDGVCSTEFLVLIAGRAAATWLHCWLLTPDVTQQIEAGCYGAKMPRTDWEHVGSILMPLPPPAEQSTIAAFLGRETTRIDALIAKKTRFIELLKEKRSALITHAVTKGLDPKTKMKDSGVEWIGQVPEHWEIRPIKSLANKTGTLFIDGDWIESKNLADCGIRYITTGNVDAGEYKEQGTGYISESTFEELRCTEVFPGDVLVSRLNPPIGRACIVPDLGDRIVTSVDNVIFRPDLDYSSVFVVYRFSAADYFHELKLLASGVTMQRVSRTELGNVRIAWPPLDEQLAIVAVLNRETARIDDLINKAQRSIDLLKERRSAFITAAVTGQIDVRGDL